MAQAEEIKIRKYLLGQLTEAEEEQVELRLLTEPDFAEEYDIVVNEITDDYVAGKFEGQELKRVEEHFFKATQRRDKLKFALALKQRKAEVDADKTKKRWFRPYLAIAAALVLLAGGGFYLWRVSSNNSDLNKGLAALQAAFREERPLEARISKFDYAPYSTTRGSGTEKIEQDELRRAELILLTLKKNPTPAVHYGLGKVHLAKKEFDQAIQEFDEALKGDPRNSQIYSDLGAAWLEKGKIDTEKAKADAADMTAGKGMEELGRSLENFNKALELDPNLLEALFNRALCEEQMTLYVQAENDWREYLKKDQHSAWADEGRRKLQRLEEQQNKKGRTKEQLLKDFLIAYEFKDDDAAWAALSLSRGRTGNLIVESLLDGYLSPPAGAQTKLAQNNLQMISYAGRLEEERVRDRYTSDLAAFYNSTKPGDCEVLVQARILMRAASGRYGVGEFDQASELYSNAKRSFAAAGDQCEALFADSWLGYCQLRALDAEKGVQHFEQLTRTFEEHRYLSLAAQSLQALADAESSLNELSKTLELSNRAMKLSEEIKDDATTVRCLTRLLITMLVFGDYPRTLQLFLRATSLAEGLPSDPRLVWPIYYETGLVFHFLRVPSAAIAFEEEALRLANVANVALLRSRSRERLGVLLSEQKKYEEAIRSGKQALAEAENVSGERAKTNMIAHSMLRLGRINSQAGKGREALSYFTKSLELYQKLDSKLYLYEAHKGKLIADLQLNDDIAADSELPIVIDLFEQHRKKISEESNRDKFFDGGQNTYDLAVDFAYSRKRDVGQAFSYSEDSRARSLFEMMHRGSQIAENSSLPEITLGAESKPLTRLKIQERLPKQAQLLEYSVLDDKVVMWVVTKSAIESGETSISSDELERKTRRYADALARPGQTDSDSIIRQAKNLHARLIAPVEKYLDRNLVLIVIPDKSLNYLPFEALMSTTSGHYLIEDYAIERAPSATIFVESSEQAKTRERGTNERLLSVGNPEFSRAEFPSLPNLPAAAREVAQIASFYQPEMHLVGEAATTRRVKGALATADVIHFATHAVADERSPLLSKLLLAREPLTSTTTAGSNGVLPVAEIYETKLPRARLVVLSACQTGIELAYRGEGAIGLARPFMVAGVPLVVASLWPVDSEAAADLMVSFHKHRKLDHVSTVEALRRAQLEIINNHQPDSQRNYGWAAFTTIGGYAAF